MVAAFAVLLVRASSPPLSVVRASLFGNTHLRTVCAGEQLSISCYLRALDICYQRYLGKLPEAEAGAGIDAFDFGVFHSPFNKLVQKSWGRLLYNDFTASPGEWRLRVRASCVRAACVREGVRALCVM